MEKLLDFLLVAIADVFRKFTKFNLVEGFVYRLFFLAMHRMLVAVDLVFNNLLENIVDPGSSFSWSFGARRTFFAEPSTECDFLFPL